MDPCKLDFVIGSDVKALWDDDEGNLRAFQDFQKNISTVVLECFGYDCSVLTDDQWGALSKEVLDQEHGLNKEPIEAIKAGFRSYVLDEGGPEMFGLEDNWE